MNATKKINVNFSSLVGLKAELLRKQTEVNEAKLRAETINAIPKVKKKHKRPKVNVANENREELTDVDDINTHKKSKLMLEAKARLYERLKKSKNKNENFLVDFANKSDESEDEISREEKENSTITDNEDDWVEYQDCFGRTRKCLREDLMLMQEKDNLIKHQIMNKKDEQSRYRDTIEQKPEIQEKEPEIEIMRRKWEEQTEKLADKVNIHYQDILFDEARAHGVGYYAFSQDEEERIKQQENLVNLRKDTERKQKEMKELKELKDRMEQNRLKAARIRQRIRAGLPPEPTEKEIAENNTETYNVNPVEDVSNASIAEENSITENSKEDQKKDDVTKENAQEEDEELIKENKVKAFGELLGKKTTWHEMSQEEWVDKCRNMRVNEFGPVYDNFKSAGYMIPNNKDAETIDYKTDQKLESTTINTDICVPSSADETVINDQYLMNTATTNNVSQDNSLNTCTYDPTSFVSNVPSYGTCYQTYAPYDKPCVETAQDNAKNTTILPNTTQNTAWNRNMNEESIVAGLRYLREKFEKSQNN